MLESTNSFIRQWHGQLLEADAPQFGVFAHEIDTIYSDPNQLLITPSSVYFKLNQRQQLIYEE